MSEDDLAEVCVYYETPDNLNRESHLENIRAIGDLLGLSGCLASVERICDGCKKTLPLYQSGLDHQCNTCGSRFDLCEDCQRGERQLDICPDGWGCKR